MCFGGSNNAKGEAKRAAQKADDMRGEEKDRQRDIRAGRQRIDSAYAGRFDPNFYKNFRNDFTGFYFPQLKDQYDDANAKLTAALVERGMNESSVGASAHGDMAETYEKERGRVANESVDAANRMRGQVENSRSNLYAMNQSVADPKAMGARAIGETTAIAAPTAFSPMGQVFAAGLEPWVAYAQHRATRPDPDRRYPPGGRFPSGAGSGSVVG